MTRVSSAIMWSDIVKKTGDNTIDTKFDSHVESSNSTLVNENNYVLVNKELLGQATNSLFRNICMGLFGITLPNIGFISFEITNYIHDHFINMRPNLQEHNLQKVISFNNECVNSIKDISNFTLDNNILVSIDRLKSLLHSIEIVTKWIDLMDHLDGHNFLICQSLIYHINRIINLKTGIDNSSSYVNYVLINYGNNICSYTINVMATSLLYHKFPFDKEKTQKELNIQVDYDLSNLGIIDNITPSINSISNGIGNQLTRVKDIKDDIFNVYHYMMMKKIPHDIIIELSLD